MYTYSNIETRHQFLEETIGPVPLESQALQNMKLIVIIAPIVVLLSIPVQFGFIWAFNKHGHPWKMFLSKDFGNVVQEKFVRSMSEALLQP